MRCRTFSLVFIYSRWQFHTCAHSSKPNTSCFIWTWNEISLKMYVYFCGTLFFNKADYALVMKSQNSECCWTWPCFSLKPDMSEVSFLSCCDGRFRVRYWSLILTCCVEKQLSSLKILHAPSADIQTMWGNVKRSDVWSWYGTRHESWSVA